MPAIDIIDELFIVAEPDLLRRALCDEVLWQSWFPGLVLTPYDDRGRLGVRWTVAGELTGTAEVWLQEHGDGTIVHVYVRADPPAGGSRRRAPSRRRVLRRYVLPLKRRLLEMKGILEVRRPLGTALVPVGERVSSASQDGQGTRRRRLRLPTGITSEGAAPDGRLHDVEHRDQC